jgi:hypothetical protein
MSLTELRWIVFLTQYLVAIGITLRLQRHTYDNCTSAGMVLGLRVANMILAPALVTCHCFSYPIFLAIRQIWKKELKFPRHNEDRKNEYKKNLAMSYNEWGKDFYNSANGSPPMWLAPPISLFAVMVPITIAHIPNWHTVLASVGTLLSAI